MAEDGPVPTDPEPAPGVDVTVPHPARIYDYLVGGTSNFAIDRAFIHEHAALAGGIGTLRTDARANRRFLGRAVRFLAGEVGIRQFLDIGSGLPSEGNVHEIDQAVAPDSHIVYVDNDPIVITQAQPLLRSTAEGSTSFIFGDVVEPESTACSMPSRPAATSSSPCSAGTSIRTSTPSASWRSEPTTDPISASCWRSPPRPARVTRCCASSRASSSSTPGSCSSTSGVPTVTRRGSAPPTPGSAASLDRPPRQRSVCLSR
jgi:hypothetical protein